MDLVTIVLAVLVVIIIFKTGSLRKGFGFFFKTLLANFFYPIGFLILGALIHGREGAIIGVVIGGIFCCVKMFTRARKDLDIDQNK